MSDKVALNTFFKGVYAIIAQFFLRISTLIGDPSILGSFLANRYLTYSFLLANKVIDEVRRNKKKRSIL